MNFYITEATILRKFGMTLEVLACSIMMDSLASLKGRISMTFSRLPNHQLSTSTTDATNQIPLKIVR